MKKKYWFDNETIQFLLTVLLLAVLIWGTIWYHHYRAQQRADSINAMTGSSYTGDDILLNGDKIRIVP